MAAVGLLSLCCRVELGLVRWEFLRAYVHDVKNAPVSFLAGTSFRSLVSQYASGAILSLLEGTGSSDLDFASRRCAS